VQIPLPIPSIVAQDDSPLILVGAQEEFPCHFYAVHALPVAIEAKKRWIRVEKKGHSCELEVNELVAYCRSKSAMVPRAIIYTKREHEAVGNVTEARLPVWPGWSSDPVQAER
jgi:hypothetical protein